MDTNTKRILKLLIWSPTVKEYQEGLKKQYEICEHKTHAKGFAFWNEYKKDKRKVDWVKVELISKSFQFAGSWVSFDIPVDSIHA